MSIAAGTCLDAYKVRSALGAGGMGELLLEMQFDEANGDVSPNGRWLAHQSNQSGRPEIHVRPFPDVHAGRWQVSPGGGGHPHWARTGGSLFYKQLRKTFIKT